ncbi:MAG: hypothetical protein LWW95_11330 [Candidatus Desulfofervidus auxilii]|nr:hypothetical protein [Candidatus Desulfofervidus auxilii]
MIESNYRIEFWNLGRLPEGWTVETLKEEHTSEPFNPLIARVFFWVGYVEEVGTGTNKMISVKNGVSQNLNLK